MNYFYEDCDFRLIEGDLYVLPNKIDFNDFHYYAYAYIKESEDKHVKLLVRLLGGDEYGDRIYTDSYYYKKLESTDHYFSKSYGKNNRFPDKFNKQVDTIIEEFNKLDGGENFNPLKRIF